MTNHRRLSSIILPALAVLSSTACTDVDATEWCVQTLYGEITTPRMKTGLNWGNMMHDETCFDLTEFQFPEVAGDSVEATTKDPVTVYAQIKITARYPDDDTFINNVFKRKRRPDLAEAEVKSAMNAGLQEGVGKFTVADIVGKRAELADTIKQSINSKLRGLAIVQQVFIQRIQLPKELEAARVRATTKQADAEAAINQLRVDSSLALGKVLIAQASADSARALAAAYATNTQVLAVEIAKYQAQICGKAQTCILGASALDAWLSAKRED